MDAIDKDTLGVILLIAGAICATVAGLIRYGLLPYLREQLQLNREIHQQVSGLPSLPAEPSTLREEVTQLGGRIALLALMFDGHLEWSQAEVDALWAALNADRDAGRHPESRHHRHRKDTTE